MKNLLDNESVSFASYSVAQLCTESTLHQSAMD